MWRAADDGRGAEQFEARPGPLPMAAILNSSCSFQTRNAEPVRDDMNYETKTAFHTRVNNPPP